MGAAKGQLTDAGSHTTQFTLDRWNQPLTITDALNRTSTIARDSIGRPTQIASFTGATSVLSYNGRDLITTRPAGADSTNYRWSTKSLTAIPGTSISITYTVLDSVWGPRQPWQQYIYAANGAIQTVKSRYMQGDPTIFKTGFATDTYGRVVADTDNAGHVTKTFYNGRYGNADSAAAHGNQWAKTVFDAEGRDSLSWMSNRPRPLILNPPGPIKDRTLYDMLNRVVNVSDGVRPDVKLEYGAIFLNKVRDRSGQVFRVDHNALGWETRRYDPADTVNWSRFVQYSYDVDGELKTRTNRRGQAITTTYDALHRRTSVSSASGTDNFGYSADGLRSASWNAISTDSSYFRANGWQDSVVTRIAGRRFRTSYLPDAYLRLDSIDISMGGSPITFPGRKYIYDPVLNVLKTIRIAGHFFGATLNRNSEAMVNSITYPLANSNSRTRTLAFTSTHQVFKDNVPSLWDPVLSYNSGYAAAYGYDSLGRIKEETLNPDFATRVSTFTYAESRL